MRTFLYIAIAMMLTASASAQVMITEIMYNPDGTDTDREWVEIFADVPTDMTDWSFTEATTLHGLTVHQGTFIVDGPAVIVDDGAAFLADYPGYSGTVLDSSFGLTNAGEEIGLHDGTVQVDTVVYTGLAESGESIELIDLALDNSDMGNWQSAVPNPGAVPVEEPVIEEPVIEEPVEEPGDDAAQVPEFSTGIALIGLAALAAVKLLRQ